MIHGNDQGRCFKPVDILSFYTRRIINMKNRHLKIILIFCVTLFVASGVFGADKKDITAQIKAVEKKVQRAYDIMAVRNLMMQVQNHIDWTSQNVQKTEGQCFGQNDGYMYGSFLKRAGAGGGDQTGGQPGAAGGPPGSSQGGASGGPPGAAQGSGQGGAAGGPPGSAQGGTPGGQPGMASGGSVGIDYHTLPSGVVEVAEDGMTAKGVWYSPGTLTEGGTMTAWIFETYSMDFAKEDGVWRLWRRRLSTDFMVAPEKSWTDSWTASGDTDVARISAIIDATKSGEYKDEARQRNVQGAGQGGASGSSQSGQGAPGGSSGGSSQDSGTKDTKTVTYQSWTATTMPQYIPKPPVPYKTFSETFAYCPPEPENLKIDADKRF
jgi:hypothetical protein